MAIKSGESITASDLTALKSKILTMYNNRYVQYAGSSSQPLSSTTNTNHSAVNNTSFTAGSSITSSGLGTLIKACLVINDIPNLLQAQDQDTSIFRDGSTTEILNGWLTDSLKNASGNSDNHGCRGACLGLCKGSCSASTCTSDCGGTCTGGCYGSCGSGCSTFCSSKAGAYCEACDTFCTTSCTRGCSSYCSSCSYGCETSCKNGCATDCTSGCYGTATSGAYT